MGEVCHVGIFLLKISLIFMVLGDFEWGNEEYLIIYMCQNSKRVPYVK